MHEGEADREARARRLFEAAIAAPEDQRTAILERARRDQPSTCAEVEALLAYHVRGSAILDRPAIEAAAALAPGAIPSASPPVETPARVATYRLLREIGRGGMGVVYEAEQDFPHRRVALKVVRPELVTPSLLRRFTHEAEALAALQHPGIAQLFEAGFAECEGDRRQPFMAMELVPGRALTAFARDPALGVRGRLELMARVCDAVDHAHRRGVIHRDLKPGNILVADGQPKVLDFGVARLTGADTPDKTMTNVGQIVGTLGYMSPEQVAGDARDVDSRTDVYSLGALLYEVLAERPPVDIAGLSVPQAALALRDREPLPLGRIDPRLRGDIETIAAKALEKQPSRRYQSAAALADDLRRCLAGEPIAARRDSSLYVLRKQIRRYRWAVAAGAAFALLIAAFAIWGAVSAASFRALARSESTAKMAESGARTALVSELRASNIERARLLAESGSAPDGEAMLWSEHAKDPRAADTLWALRDTYARYPCRAALTGHEAPTEGVAVSPDGSVLVSGDRRGQVRVWDTRTGANLRRMQGADEWVRAIAILNDNRTAFVSTGDGSLTHWDLSTGSPVRSVVAHAHSRFWLAASPDGRLLATAGPVGDSRRATRLWDAATLEPVADVGTQDAPLAYVAFSGDGGRLVSSGADGFRVYDLRTRSLLGHAPAGNLLCAAFSPDGSRIATGAVGGTVGIWSAASLERESRISHDPIWDVRSVAFTPDGRRLIFADSWNIFVTDAAGNGVVARLAPCSSIISSFALSSDGTMLASTAGDRAVRLWDLSTDGPRTWLEPPPESRAYLNMVAVSGKDLHGGTIAVVNESGVTNLWRASNLTPLGSLRGTKVRVFDITFSRDGARLATGAVDGFVRVWDIVSPLPIAEFRAHNVISNLRFSPDGGTLATAGVDGRVRLWNVSDWSERADIVTGPGESRMVRFTPDGSLLLANNRSGTLLFIDPADGRVLETLRDETPCWGLDISPDGTCYALGDGTRAIRIVDLASRRTIVELFGHREIAWSVAFSSDGTLLASESADGLLKVWDTKLGRCLITLEAADQGMLFPLEFIPGTQRLVTGHGYRGAAVWDFTHFDRFIAGNADWQLRRLEGRLAPDQLAAARQWAKGLVPADR